MTASIEVVVVLPCVPATASVRFPWRGRRAPGRARTRAGPVGGPRRPRGCRAGIAVEITTASGSPDLFGAVARRTRSRPERAQVLEAPRVLEVRAADGDPSRDQQPGDPAHAGAPDPDQVHAVDLGQCRGPSASGCSPAAGRRATTHGRASDSRRGSHRRPRRRRRARSPRPGGPTRRPPSPSMRAGLGRPTISVIRRARVSAESSRRAGSAQRRPLERARVRVLLVRASVRIRNQQRRSPADRDLRDAAGARSRHDEVGGRVRRDPSGRGTRGSARAASPASSPSRIALFAAPSNTISWRSSRWCRCRAAPAIDSSRWRAPWLPPKTSTVRRPGSRSSSATASLASSLASSRHGEDLVADGVARDHRSRAARQRVGGLLEGERDGVGPAGDEAVREPGHRVLLVDHERPARPDRGERRRDAHVAPGADDDVGAGDERRASQDGAQRDERGARACRDSPRA